jgi:hypothetical protein
MRCASPKPAHVRAIAKKGKREVCNISFSSHQKPPEQMNSSTRTTEPAAAASHTSTTSSRGACRRFGG